jgi:hypothetical protein
MKDIQKFEGERVEAPWLSVLPEKLQAQVAPLIGAKKFYESERDRWYWGISPKVKYLIEQSNPFIRSMGKVAMTASGEAPYYAKERAPYDVMSWITGVKLMPYNPLEAMERNIFERRDQLRNIKRSAEQQGKVPSYYLPEAPNVPRTH